MKNSLPQYSNKSAVAHTLAGQFELLRRFANLREEDAEKFRAEHPAFLLLPQLQRSGWELGVRLRSPRALDRAKEIAQDQPNPVLWFRDMLRRIWRDDEHANDYLKLLLYSSKPSPDRVDFSWKHGQIVYAPENELESVVHALFRNSALAKVCEADGCPAPYFIARRRSQRYCSADCAAQLQKKWKLEWWQREGAQRRQEQQASKAKNAKKEGKR